MNTKQLKSDVVKISEYLELLMSGSLDKLEIGSAKAYKVKNIIRIDIKMEG